MENKGRWELGDCRHWYEIVVFCHLAGPTAVRNLKNFFLFLFLIPFFMILNFHYPSFFLSFSWFLLEPRKQKANWIPSYEWKDKRKEGSGASQFQVQVHRYKQQHPPFKLYIGLLHQFLVKRGLEAQKCRMIGREDEIWFLLWTGCDWCI